MLTENRADALTEVMNLGMGHAANALNQLVGTHISLRVPGVSMLRAWEVERGITAMGWDPAPSVQVKFDGLMHGNMALMFPADSAEKLAILLTGQCSPDAGSRKAAIEETGNILLNGVIGAFSDLLRDHVTFSIPAYSESTGILEQLTSACERDARGILSRAHFEVAQHQIEGEIFVYFEVRSVNALYHALDCHCAMV